LEDVTQSQTTGAILFHWKDSAGQPHVASPKISQTGVQFLDTGEELPDFFFFTSNMTYSSVENADRFSEMSRAKGQNQFVQLFSTEYPWIEDLSIESVAGVPVIYASIKGLPDKLFLGNVSGGLNWDSDGEPEPKAALMTEQDYDRPPTISRSTTGQCGAPFCRCLRGDWLGTQCRDW
jgi:hypothetical protein